MTTSCRQRVPILQRGERRRYPIRGFLATEETFQEAILVDTYNVSLSYFTIDIYLSKCYNTRMRRKKIPLDKEQLSELLKERSITEIASKYDCHIKTVYGNMKKLGIVPPKYGNTSSHLRRGSVSVHWKGGKRRTPEGYIRVYQPEHPYAAEDRTVLEHRLVMEQKLGRYLKPHEIVHHNNGIKHDNRPENLELTVSTNHRGKITCPYCSKEFHYKRGILA